MKPFIHRRRDRHRPYSLSESHPRVIVKNLEDDAVTLEAVLASISLHAQSLPLIAPSARSVTASPPPPPFNPLPKQPDDSESSQAMVAYATPAYSEKENLMNPRKRDKPPIRKEAASQRYDSGILTISLNCRLANCQMVFPDKHKLALHLEAIHHIYPHVCVRRGCQASFKDAAQLSLHLATDHGNQQHWSCTYCDTPFSSHEQLSYHTEWKHHQGVFDCAACGNGRSDTRSEVTGHIEKAHKLYYCPVFGCPCVYIQKHNLSRHQKIHFTSIRPYACIWPDCTFSSELRNKTLGHIKLEHLKKGQTSSQETGKRQAKDYIHVNQALVKEQKFKL